MLLELENVIDCKICEELEAETPKDALIESVGEEDDVVGGGVKFVIKFVKRRFEAGSIIEVFPLDVTSIDGEFWTFFFPEALPFALFEFIELVLQDIKKN